MPETTREWVVFVVGLIVVGLLCALIVVDPRPSDSSANRSALGTTASTASDAVVTTSDRTTHPRSSKTTSVTPTPTANELRFTAKADTWVSVRRATSSGSVLFEGTMFAHETRTFTGKSFHVRFGAAANLTARLNGRPLSLPGGTYSATITRSGLGGRTA